MSNIHLELGGWGDADGFGRELRVSRKRLAASLCGASSGGRGRAVNRFSGVGGGLEILGSEVSQTK